MSNRCVHCNEAWNFDDYVCPCCDRSAIEQDSHMRPTLKYKIKKPSKIGAFFEYDVIRISTGKSVFDEPENYSNQESK